MESGSGNVDDHPGGRNEEMETAGRRRGLPERTRRQRESAAAAERI